MPYGALAHSILVVFCVGFLSSCVAMDRIAETQERVRLSRLFDNVDEDPGYLVGRGLVRDWESFGEDIKIPSLRNYFQSPRSFSSILTGFYIPQSQLDLSKIEQVSQCIDVFFLDSRTSGIPLHRPVEACTNQLTGDGLPCSEYTEVLGAPGFEYSRVLRICVVEVQGELRIEFES